MEVVPAAVVVLADIIMAATEVITKVTTRVVVEEAVAMEEMVMTIATAMVSVLAPLNCNYSVFKM